MKKCIVSSTHEGLPLPTHRPRARSYVVATMSRDDDNASKIAEKLLQGWTMLAEYCPADGCTTPLMRGRDGRRFCVAHDMYVMSPEEAEDMKRKGGGVGGGDATATKASPTPAPGARSHRLLQPASRGAIAKVRSRTTDARVQRRRRGRRSQY